MSAVQVGGDRRTAKLKLAVGAIGIVFGDIGTSPIYAFRETFVGPHKLAIDDLHILGVVSLIFWSMTIVVSLQYVTILLRADNKGEGGTLALVAMLGRYIGKSKWNWLTVLLAVAATSLFYGDSMITPAISVLSAVEGLTTVEAGLSRWVVPIALGLLIGLFFLQKRGTTKVGTLFAPIMLLYFMTLAVLGVWHIFDYPGILAALNPWHAIQFFMIDKTLAFRARFGRAGGDRRRGALFRHGAFRTWTAAPVVVWFCYAVPAAELFRTRGDDYRHGRRLGCTGDQ